MVYEVLHSICKSDRRCCGSRKINSCSLKLIQLIDFFELIVTGLLIYYHQQRISQGKQGHLTFTILLYGNVIPVIFKLFGSLFRCCGCFRLWTRQSFYCARLMAWILSLIALGAQAALTWALLTKRVNFGAMPLISDNQIPFTKIDNFLLPQMTKQHQSEQTNYDNLLLGYCVYACDGSTPDCDHKFAQYQNNDIITTLADSVTEIRNQKVTPILKQFEKSAPQLAALYKENRKFESVAEFAHFGISETHCLYLSQISSLLPYAYWLLWQLHFLIVAKSFDDKGKRVLKKRQVVAWRKASIELRKGGLVNLNVDLAPTDMERNQGSTNSAVMDPNNMSNLDSSNANGSVSETSEDQDEAEYYSEAQRGQNVSNCQRMSRLSVVPADQSSTSQVNSTNVTESLTQQRRRVTEALAKAKLIRNINLSTKSLSHFQTNDSRTNISAAYQQTTGFLEDHRRNDSESNLREPYHMDTQTQPIDRSQQAQVENLEDFNNASSSRIINISSSRGVLLNEFQPENPSERTKRNVETEQQQLYSTDQNSGVPAGLLHYQTSLANYGGNQKTQLITPTNKRNQQHYSRFSLARPSMSLSQVLDMPPNFGNQAGSGRRSVMPSTQPPKSILTLEGTPQQMGQKTAEKWFQKHTRIFYREKDAEEPFYELKKQNRMLGRQSLEYCSQFQGPQILISPEKIENGGNNNVLSEEDEDEERIVCAVCQERIKNYDEIVELRCQHLYHKECIKDWVLKERNCPTCRKKQFIPKKKEDKKRQRS